MLLPADARLFLLLLKSACEQSEFAKRLRLIFEKPLCSHANAELEPLGATHSFTDSPENIIRRREMRDWTE